MKVPEANQAPQTFAQVFAEPGQLCHDERTSHKLTSRSRNGHKRKTVTVDQLLLDPNRNPPNDSMETTILAIDLIESRQRDSALEPTHGSADDASSLSAGTKLHRGDTS